MSSQLNAYEFIGVIAPGSVVVFVTSLAIPEVRTLIGQENISIGGLGLFIILAFVVGHLLQAFGNLLEKLVWAPFSGMPTSWLRQPSQSLLAGPQLSKLTLKLAENHPGFEGPAKVSESDWFSYTREIYAAVQGGGRAERVDSFNRAYGLLRGIAAAFAVSAAGALIFLGLSGWKVVLVLALASGVAIYRMYRFGVHYARELFVQYLRL